LFRIGSFEITSFGVLVATGALVGLWLFRRELRRAGLPDDGIDAAFAGVFGGLFGAKLWWTVEFYGTEPFLSLLFSRGGLSWFGGLTAGLAAGLTVIRVKRLPLVSTLAAAAPALAIGHAIGRIGCFMVGDDYGKVSELPWAVAFPQGLPPTLARVHPTQLYEAIPLFMIGWLLLLSRRRKLDDRVILGLYFVMAGTTRFAIEFVRVNERVLGPLTIAHSASLGVTALGAVLLLSATRSPMYLKK
jgi:phosphatidylglycerol---prolipoprotein diacylglyceryl transferase